MVSGVLFVTVIPLIKWSPFYVVARQRCHAVASGPVRLNHDSGRVLCHVAIARQPASVIGRPICTFIRSCQAPVAPTHD